MMRRSSTNDANISNARRPPTATTRDERSSMTLLTMPLAPPPRPPISPASARSTLNGLNNNSLLKSREGSADAHRANKPSSPRSVVSGNFGVDDFHKQQLLTPPEWQPKAASHSDPPHDSAMGSHLSVYESILHETMSKFGPDDPRVGAAMHNVAMVHLNNHNFDTADCLFSRAVYLLQRSSTVNLMDVAVSLLKLGVARKHRRLYQAAISSIQDALDIVREHTGEEGIVMADMISHLGHVYHDMGHLPEAQRIFQDCLELYQAKSPELEGYAAEMLCNIGTVQLQRRDYTGAIKSFAKVLPTQEALFGPCHPHVIATLDNLGVAHCRAKEYDSALKYYETMLTAQTAHYRTWNMECCETLMKKNIILEKRETYAAALKGTVMVLALQQKLLPPDDPAIQDTHVALERLERKCQQTAARCKLM